jgi:hypothetical protein
MVVVRVTCLAAEMDLPSRSDTLVESVNNNLTRLRLLERNFGDTVGVGAAFIRRVKSQGTWRTSVSTTSGK